MECPLCFDNMVDPRVLPCGHSLCGPPSNCIQKIEKDGKITCPYCRKEHTIQVTELQPLYGIRDVLKKLSEGKKEEVVEEAQSCSHEIEESPKCYNHKKPFISFCQEEHCKVNVCQDCFEESHEGHKVVSYKKHLIKEVTLAVDIWERNGELLQTCCDQSSVALQSELSVLMKRTDEIKENLAYLKEVEKTIEGRNAQTILARNWVNNLGASGDFKPTDAVNYLNGRNSFHDIMPGYVLESVQRCPINTSVVFRFNNLKSWAVNEMHRSTTFRYRGFNFWVQCLFIDSTDGKPWFGVFLNCSPIFWQKGWTLYLPFSVELANNIKSKYYNCELHDGYTYRGWFNFISKKDLKTMKCLDELNITCKLGNPDLPSGKNTGNEINVNFMSKYDDVKKWKHGELHYSPGVISNQTNYSIVYFALFKETIRSIDYLVAIIPFLEENIYHKNWLLDSDVSVFITLKSANGSKNSVSKFCVQKGQETKGKTGKWTTRTLISWENLIDPKNEWLEHGDQMVVEFSAQSLNKESSTGENG